MAEQSNYLLVAALDFGTTYSGYAFSTRHEFKEDPLRIHANQAWNSGGRSLLSLKTPTSLLLNHQKDIVAFGYEAENKYIEIVMDEEQSEYFFFNRFKMKLHNNKNISTSMVLEDITGKPLPAIDVFSLSIKALVDHLMDILEKQGIGMEKTDIKWVLTVPAIWSDSAKQFMRQSAERAGIPQDSLLLALEPEAASIYCRYLPTNKLQGSRSGFTINDPGTKYMVVDLGGGTTDITVHNTLPNGKIEEIFRATGNDCGGSSVDGRFFQFMVKLFGGPVMKMLKDDDPSGYLDLFRDFETVKRTIQSSKQGKVNMTIPFISLNEKCKKHLGEEISEILSSCSYSNEIALKGDKVRIDADLMKTFFQPTIESIISLMKELFTKSSVGSVSQILLVGGFGECELVQNAIKREFKEKRLIVPDEAALSVLKGAVLFGHKPDHIMSRKMKYTYGVEVNTVFLEGEHNPKYKVIIDGKPYCEKVFEKIVTINETIEVGETRTASYTATGLYSTTDQFSMYISTEENPTYTDEETCSHLGIVTIPLSEPDGTIREIIGSYTFGGTELSLIATEVKSGKIFKAKFDLL